MEKSQKTILWISPQKDIEHSKSFANNINLNAAFRDLFIFSFSSAEEFIQTPQGGVPSEPVTITPAIAVYVLDDDSSFADLICHKIFNTGSLSSLLINSGKIDSKTFKKLINSHCDAFFADFQDAGNLEAILNQSVQFYQDQEKKQANRKDSLESKRELETVNKALELEVQKRTEHIEESHQEERSKLIKQRQLIKFMQDLAAISSVEDILVLMANEIKRFHWIGAPVLCVKSGTDVARIYALQGRQILKKEAFLDPVSENFSKDLANLLGRPFGRMKSFSLETRVSKEFSEEKMSAYLSFEYQWLNENMKEFNEFIEDRTRLIGIAMDRLFYESALTLFSYRWAQTFVGVRDPILIVDNQFEILKSNRRELTNIHKASGKCYEVLFNQSMPCESCPQGMDYRNLKSVQSQFKKDEKFYQIYSYPIWGSDSQKPEKYVNYYSDVTSDRQLYMQMVQTEKMSTLGLLAGNIAHELSNPLTGIRSLVQILLKEVTPQTNLYDDLLEIEKATSRCQKIIKNLLDFSILEPAKTVKVEMSELVRSTLPLLKIAMRKHKVFLEYAKEDLYVEGAAQLLQQVIFNLVNNAVQAMLEPGVLSIHTFQDESSVFIEVCDTGPGISQEHQNQLFQPFFTTKAMGQGTGLGLSFSRSVVERFGGHLSYQDHIPQGACFVIELPRSRM